MVKTLGGQDFLNSHRSDTILQANTKRHVAHGLVILHSSHFRDVGDPGNQSHSIAVDRGACRTARAYARESSLRQVSLGYPQRRDPQVRVLTVASEGQPDLVKPFTPSQLLAAVRRAARR